jgi:hypothetical protein
MSMSDPHKAHLVQPPLNHLFDIPSHVTSKMKILARMSERFVRSHWLNAKVAPKLLPVQAHIF